MAVVMVASLAGFTIYTAHAQSDVVLQTAYDRSHDIQTTETNTIHAIVQNMTGSRKTVLVDLELFGPNGTRVQQKIFDNVPVDPYNIATESFDTSANLNPGTYTLKVGIFNPGFNGLLAWYGNALSFDVHPVNSSGSSGGTSSGDNSGVILSGSALGESHLNNCPPLTALLQNNSSANKNVLVDFELRNSSGALINQFVVDNYSVSPSSNGSVQSLMNQCNVALNNDTYTYSVGIFNPGWNGLVHWYSNVRSFTVSSAPTTSSSSVQIVRIDRPTTNLPVGSSFNVTPTLISPNQTLQNATIKVSLTDQSGAVKFSQTFNNQTLQQGVQMNFPLQVNSAPAGTYSVKIEILNANGQTLQTFTNLGTVVVQ